MKKLLRVLLVLIVVLVAGGVVADLYIDSLVKTTVEEQATRSLGLKTTLRGADLSILGGELTLSGLAVASPPGFSAPSILELGSISIRATRDELGAQPVHIRSITLNGLKLVVEQVGGKLNFKEAANGMLASPKGAEGPTGGGAGAPMKLVIDELQMKDAEVLLLPGMPGQPGEIAVPIKALAMQKIGGAAGQDGVELKDLLIQIVATLVAEVNVSNLGPTELQTLLRGDLTNLMGALGPDAQKRMLESVPADAGKALSGFLPDPAAAGKDPAGALGGLLGGVPGMPAPPQGASSAGATDAGAGQDAGQDSGSAP